MRYGDHLDYMHEVWRPRLYAWGMETLATCMRYGDLGYMHEVWRPRLYAWGMET